MAAADFPLQITFIRRPVWNYLQNFPLPGNKAFLQRHLKKNTPFYFSLEIISI
jgi:hypothetical protein